MGSSTDVTGTINLGNQNEFTIKSIAEIIIELMGSKSKLTFKPLLQDDPRQRHPDISRARELLGWKPTVQFRDSVQITIAYFDALLSGTSHK
ncbi:MAG: hypothetical protein CTY31_02325 [Hyphomicrobium sp.]|nr:MAG: hypothetical protein CTY39_03840 [Hyphomicrobium sp.]PPD01610.1 MAG: hypothetical protein CTY31_02325 [Hyphomicrobium sp.]